MVICLERGADLHMAQLMPLPLTVSCFSKIQFGFTFPVPAHPGSPGPLNGCECVCLHQRHRTDEYLDTRRAVATAADRVTTYRSFPEVAVARWRTVRVIISLFLHNQSQRSSFAQFAVIGYAQSRRKQFESGGHMASAEREPIREFGGGAPSGVPGQSPWSGG